VGSKRKKKSSGSNIDNAQLQAMMQQQMLADEARSRESALISQQTAEQSEQFQGMLGVYQAQAAALQQSKVEQEKYLKDLEAQQAEQLKGVRAAQSREENIANQAQRKNVSATSRAYGMLSERRSKSVSNRASVFGNASLPSGYSVNKGIM